MLVIDVEHANVSRKRIHRSMITPSREHPNSFYRLYLCSWNRWDGGDPRCYSSVQDICPQPLRLAKPSGAVDHVHSVLMAHPAP